VALVGSHARGAARWDSDVDVVMVTTNPVAYTSETDWLSGLGAQPLATRQWGALTELRLVLRDGTEVDFGVVKPSWTDRSPVDPGTARVVRDGLVALHDPDGLLAAVAAEVARGVRT
jgi:hypothetical protein